MSLWAQNARWRTGNDYGVRHAFVDDGVRSHPNIIFDRDTTIQFGTRPNVAIGTDDGSFPVKLANTGPGMDPAAVTNTGVIVHDDRTPVHQPQARVFVNRIFSATQKALPGKYRILEAVPGPPAAKAARRQFSG